MFYKKRLGWVKWQLTKISPHGASMPLLTNTICHYGHVALVMRTPIIENAFETGKDLAWL